MPIKPSKIQEQFYKRLKEGQYKAAENLIKKGANINYEYEHPEFDTILCPLLSKMILMGNRTAVEFLLRKGANPNGGKGLTPLSCIIHRDDSQSDYKNTEIIQSLKQYGADFTNIKNYDNSKESLLFTAVCLSKKGLVEYLLSNAVGVEVQTESYMTLPRDNMISQITPLHMAAFLGYSPTIVEQLLVSGANPLKADSYGNTALHLVAYPDPRYMSALPPGSHLTQNE
jgi:hypothetical protein